MSISYFTEHLECVPCVQDAAESSGEHMVRTAIHDVKNICSTFCSHFCRHVVCDDRDVTEHLKRDDESYCCGSSDDSEGEDEELYGSDWDLKDVPNQRLQTGGELKRDLKQSEVVLPFCMSLSTRDAIEVHHEALYPAVPGTRVTRLHSDCASEFTRWVAELIVRGLARQNLVGSHLPNNLWSFAVQHAVEALSVKRLRLGGDILSAECWPFGTYVTDVGYVALRVPGAVKPFVGANEVNADDEFTRNSHGWKRVSLEGVWLLPAFVAVAYCVPFPCDVADVDAAIVCPDQGKGTGATSDGQMGTSYSNRERGTPDV
eukprot:1400592-Amphidinium_carterae.1